MNGENIATCPYCGYITELTEFAGGDVVMDLLLCPDCGEEVELNELGMDL
jgi:DNA-directed RNA polymerase subunit RPC12/RpoP